MASHAVHGERSDPFTSLNWLNTGIIHLDRQGWLTVHNELAAKLLDIDVPTGASVRIENCLSTDREEYQLLQHIVTSGAEVRNQLITWAEKRRIRHVLIDSYRDDSRVFLQADETKPMPANADDFPAKVVPSRFPMAVHGASGTGMYIMMKDLGDFVLLDQHLQRAEKLAIVGKVAAGVAHEIRNPLTTVRGFLQVMHGRMEEHKMDEEQNYLNMMVNEVDKVESLVKELLLLSKPHRSAKRRCQLGGLVALLQSEIEAQAREKQIETEFCIEDKLPSIIGDEDLLSHVITQLVENAFDAMDAGGRLTVRVYRDHKLVCLDVRDTGSGIPYYHMDQVFDAFFTTKEKGTGLGLPICQRIIADHGGEIHVSSKGFGTTFTLLLPLT